VWFLEGSVPEADTMILEPVHASDESRDDSQDNEHCRAAPEQERELGGHREHLLPSEAEILERFGRTAVKTRRATLVTATRSKVALGDPGCGAVGSG
jgi:hypothetical protein